MSPAVPAAVFSSGPRTVRAPATSANLGPGFDAFGLALNQYDEVTAEVLAAGLEIIVTGEGDQQVALDDSHLVITAMRATFALLGVQPPGLRLRCDNRIPHGRGLGSSAAAIVSGVCLARALVVDGAARLDAAGMLALASELEGHPDNVAACLLGGFTIAWQQDGVTQATRLRPRGIRPVLFIPTTQSGTKAARAALPETVSHADAAFNAGRAALLVCALTGSPELLMAATEDRLHQAQRATGMSASAELMGRLRKLGVPAVISGAGSTVLAFAIDERQISLAADAAPAGWKVQVSEVSDGAELIVGELAL
ncbi:MAG: homoserine kinase [Frankiales bacterium]|nr:homoserine kinase [Frankiales bacterium]